MKADAKHTPNSEQLPTFHHRIEYAMTTTTIELPVGESPGWEEEEGDDLKGPATRYVVGENLMGRKSLIGAPIAC